MGTSILISGFARPKSDGVENGNMGEGFLQAMPKIANGHTKRPQSSIRLRPQCVVGGGKCPFGGICFGTAISPSCAPKWGKLARVTSFPQFLRTLYRVSAAFIVGTGMVRWFFPKNMLNSGFIILEMLTFEKLCDIL